MWKQEIHITDKHKKENTTSLSLSTKPVLIPEEEKQTTFKLKLFFLI